MIYAKYSVDHQGTGVRPNKVEKLLKKTRCSLENSVTKDVENLALFVRNRNVVNLSTFSVTAERSPTRAVRHMDRYCPSQVAES